MQPNKPSQELKIWNCMGSWCISKALFVLNFERKTLHFVALGDVKRNLQPHEYREMAYLQAKFSPEALG
jgi:hypothetical protein